ncbi:MAG: serine/threonine protein kinase, partial [Bacteroidetes bacterium]
MAILNNRYEFDPATDELGRGGFGRVFRAKDTFLNREVVLKYAAKGDLPDKYSLIEEIKRVIDFNHPNLTRYFDAMTDRAESGFGETVEYQIGVMEYVRGGNLQDFLASRPTEEQLRPIILGILEGLDYLHKQGIIHRDIKPKNILLQPEDGKLIPKICDFGISKSAGGEMTALSNVIGTFEYMSPEQLGNNPDQRIGTNADLWSLGVVMYEMFTGELPFGSQRSGQTSAQVIGNILRAETPPKLNQIPQPYRTAISQCLVLDARNRVR